MKIQQLTPALVLAMVCAGSIGNASAADAGLERARATLVRYSGNPEFVAPGEAFDAKVCASGKKILAIPFTSANPFLKGITDRMKRVGSELGLTVTEWENQGQPNQHTQGVNYAIQAKFDMITLPAGIDPNALGPSLRAAKGAGVKVATTHFYDPGMVQNSLLSSSLTIGFNEVGRILADWSIVRTGGKANIIIIKSDDAPPTGAMVRGITEQLAANCPTCKITQQINVGLAEWATKIQPSLQAALQAHPEVNVVLPIYDSMSQFVVPAVALTGRAQTVAVGTFNGTPFALDFVRNGKVDLDIGESLDWIAYATIDGHLRDLCGLPVPKSLNVPFYLFDKSNVTAAGVPASFDKGYGNAYISGFRTLWKLSR